jgi:hypothetical protein
MNRRAVLKGVGAVTAGSAGLAFGSGAFSTTEADRDFTVGLAASDAESQLVIAENNDLPSSAVGTDGDGKFIINDDGITPGATTTFGRFETIDDPETLAEGAFVVRNENKTGEAIDISVEIDLENSPMSEIALALLSPGDTEVAASGMSNDSVSAEVESVPSNAEEGTADSEAAAEVEVGLIVAAATNDDDLSAVLTVEGEQSGGD